MSGFRFKRAAGESSYEVLEDGAVIGAVRKYERRYNLQRMIVVRGWTAHTLEGERLPRHDGCYGTREDAAEALSSLSLKLAVGSADEDGGEKMSIEGSNLRFYRSEMGLRLRDVSEKTGVSVAHLSELERGESKMSVDVLRKIGKGIGIPLADLLGVPPAVMWETCPTCDGRGMVRPEHEVEDATEARG